jgi:Beta-ketoacyl synthase, N-terminal domain
VEGVLPFRLTAWCAWSPACDTQERWLRWAGVSHGRSASTGFPLATAPAMTRRRATALGQKGLSAALALPEVDRARIVLASRHGEFARTLAILDTLARRDQPSPTDFSMSVHNALAGLISIAKKSALGHTAISAGPESFCCGMLEAVAAVRERPCEPAILLYLDEPPGGGFSDLIAVAASASPLVVALGLAAAESSAGEAMTMAMRAAPADHDDGEPALEFLRFALTGDRETAITSQDHAWVWRRE